MKICEKCGCSYDAWDGGRACEKEEKEKASAVTEADAVQSTTNTIEKIAQTEASYKCFIEMMDKYFFRGIKNG